jgi:hypothetical protein
VVPLLFYCIVEWNVVCLSIRRGPGPLHISGKEVFDREREKAREERCVASIEVEKASLEVEKASLELEKKISNHCESKEKKQKFNNSYKN